ncbi:MAG: winged helix-turn-helix domain-containing protein, partial [Rhodanobacteraceae bacterium]
MITAYRFGGYTLTARTRELRRGDTPIAISPRAFDCLAYLCAHRDRAVGKDELVAAIWERVDVSDTQLGQIVLRARRAVDDDGQAQTVIRTVSRFGYRWVAAVEIDEVEPCASRPPATEETPVEAEPEAALPIETRATTVTEPVARSRSRHPALAFAIGVAAVVAVALAWRLVPSARHLVIPTQGATSAVVLPFRVAAGASDTWLRLGAMDLVADRLRLGGLAVPPSETTVAVIEDTRDGSSTSTSAIRRVAPGALVFDGEIARAYDSWTVSLHALAADGASLSVASTKNDALDAARDASDRLLGRLGRSHASMAPLADAVQERLQRAQAALLANDLDTARAILVGDPALARSEPELGYRLAMVDFRAGEYARAGASLTPLIADAHDPAFRARALDGRGAVRIREDDFAGAEADYDAAIALLQDSGNAAELGRALTGRG